MGGLAQYPVPEFRMENTLSCPRRAAAGCAELRTALPCLLLGALCRSCSGLCGAAAPPAVLPGWAPAETCGHGEPKPAAGRERCTTDLHFCSFYRGCKALFCRKTVPVLLGEAKLGLEDILRLFDSLCTEQTGLEFNYTSRIGVTAIQLTELSDCLYSS